MTDQDKRVSEKITTTQDRPLWQGLGAQRGQRRGGRKGVQALMGVWEAAGRRSEDLSQWAEQEKGKAALHMLNQLSEVL